MYELLCFHKHTKYILSKVHIITKLNKKKLLLHLVIYIKIRNICTIYTILYLINIFKIREKYLYYSQGT